MPARADVMTDEKIRFDLLLARRGQAFYARKLAELSDGQLSAASAVEGRSRARIAVDVALRARTLARVAETARAGSAVPFDEPEAPGDFELQYEPAFAATLPPQAVRNLASHAAIHLNVEWRELPAAGWYREVDLGEGETLTSADGLRGRARELWVRAIDFGNGATFEQLPAALLDRILAEAVASWSRRTVPDGSSLTLEPIDRDQVVTAVEEPAGKRVVLRGTAARLAAWSLGRGQAGVLTDAGDPPPTPDPVEV